MFNFAKNKAPDPKFFITHGLLPRHVETNQLPSAKMPFSMVMKQKWSHTVELILPEQLYDVAWKQIEPVLGQSLYVNLKMSLPNILEGDFFNQYIKTGNITMLSEGRAGIDRLYSLNEGILRIELPKDEYECAGLVGKSIPDGGQLHREFRYAIEINLREPAMVRGRKGFDRIVWAAENVLKEPVKWLFIDHNVAQTKASGKAPHMQYKAVETYISRDMRQRHNILVPPLKTPSSSLSIDSEDFMDLLEWIGLVSLDSPRIFTDDSIDPYLSRYQVPERHDAEASDVVCIRWRGFLLGDMVRQLLSKCILAAQTQKHAWFSLSTKSFRGESSGSSDGYTLFCFPEKRKEGEGEDKSSRSTPMEYISWEMMNTVTDRQIHLHR